MKIIYTKYVDYNMIDWKYKEEYAGNIVKIEGDSTESVFFSKDRTFCCYIPVELVNNIEVLIERSNLKGGIP